MKRENKELINNIDWIVTLIPLISVVVLGLFFAFVPEESTLILDSLRGIVGDDFGFYFIIIGLGMFLL